MFVAFGGMLALSAACRHSEIWLGPLARDEGTLETEPDAAVVTAPPFDAQVFDAAPEASTPSTAADAGVPILGVPPLADAGDEPSDAAADGGKAPRLEPILPALAGSSSACPARATGAFTIRGLSARMWVGEPKPSAPGPLVIYWHGTGSTAGEPETMLGEVFTRIMNEGGVLVSLQDSTMSGDAKDGVAIWYVGDLDIIDELVACAAANYTIDPHQIYSMGCSSGGVQATVLANMRSNYIAATAPNSGGAVQLVSLQDPTRVPAVMTAHGDTDTDVVIVSFAETSLRYDRAIADAGGFAVDCNHSGGHCGAPPDLRVAQWQFLKEHPYGVTPEPYRDTLPSSFPSYCQIIAK